MIILGKSAKRLNQNLKQTLIEVKLLLTKCFKSFLFRYNLRRGSSIKIIWKIIIQMSFMVIMELNKKLLSEMILLISFNRVRLS